MPEMITRAHLVRQLLDMGVQPGGVLVVHTAFSKVRPVEGGPGGADRGAARSVGAGRYAGDARHDRGRRPPL